MIKDIQFRADIVPILARFPNRGQNVIYVHK